MNGGGATRGSAETRRARAALSRIMEPGDLTGLALVAVAGPVGAHRLVAAHRGRAPATEQQAVAELLGGGNRAEHQLDAGLERWRPRLHDSDPDRDLGLLGRLGGGVVVPEDPDWPAQLGDLGLAQPLCLWWRGAHAPPALPPVSGLLAVVGSRDATEYGRHVTAELCGAVAREGVVVVSGGAYGIDARAHEAALASWGGAGPATVAVMAGGLDRFYPAGNDQLLRRVAERGTLLAEVAPGTAPTRWRFLQRNRLIAALCGASVVVEARWRSGALSTARRAAEIGREVGAFPGSVHSPNSAGCHRLVREGAATLVTDGAEVLELLGDAPAAPAAEAARDAAAARSHDGLDIQDLLLLDALPVKSPSTPDKLATVAGLGMGAVLGGLSRLEARGLAVRSAAGWRRGHPDA